MEFFILFSRIVTTEFVIAFAVYNAISVLFLGVDIMVMRSIFTQASVQLMTFVLFLDLCCGAYSQHLFKETMVFFLYGTLLVRCF